MKVIDLTLLDKVSSEAKESPRLRKHRGNTGTGSCFVEKEIEL